MPPTQAQIVCASTRNCQRCFWYRVKRSTTRRRDPTRRRAALSKKPSVPLGRHPIGERRISAGEGASATGTYLTVAGGIERGTSEPTVLLAQARSISPMRHGSYPVACKPEL